MADRRSRHMARRRRRLTPRRWPVLLVVPALLIGAGIVEADREESGGPAPDASSVTRELAALQPTAGTVDALSSGVASLSFPQADDNDARAST